MLRLVRSEKDGRRTWHFYRCACGKEIRRNIQNYTGKSCSGCYRRGKRGPGIQPGFRSGKVVLVERLPGQRGIVKCDCGSPTREVLISNLMSGFTRSCGCMAGKNNITHGMTSHPGYHIWQGIRSRCVTGSNVRSWKYYGGRGIRVCQRWRSSVEAFVDDMWPRPSAQHSIDRIDNEGHYSCGKCEECVASGWPANCRWATAKEQANNTRDSVDSVYLEHNGERLCCADWARRIGVSRQAIEQRIRAGWSVERIVTTGRPSHSEVLVGKRRRARLVEFAGFELTVSQWAKRLGIPRERIRRRLDAGKPPAVAFSAERIPVSAETRAKLSARSRERNEKRNARLASRSLRLATKSGVPRRIQHKPHQCSVCRQVGHNRATCASRSEAA